MAALATILSIATYAGLVFTIPPPQCFANFNWKDCGKSPQPVIYYRKAGSRCEVGIWRGCLPNINMFKDEYECVSTCIFTVRAAEQDWHQINADEEDITGNMTDYEDKGFSNITSESGGEPVTESEGKLESESEPDTGSKGEPVTEPETGSKDESVTEPDTGSKDESVTEPEAGSKDESVTEPVTEPETGTDTVSADESTDETVSSNDIIPEHETESTNKTESLNETESADVTESTE